MYPKRLCVEHISKTDKHNLRLDFGVVLWIGAVFSLVFLCAASSSLPVLFLFALFWSIGLFVILFKLSSPLHALVLALLFLLVFNTTYMPMFGLFSSINNEPSGIFKYALGLRSAWFSGAMLVVAFLIYIRKDIIPQRSTGVGLVLFLIYLIVSFVFSDAAFDSRATYVLNSFVPLAMFFYFIPVILKNRVVDVFDLNILNRSILILIVFGAAYFLLLPFLYDTFRPDLASYLRARVGEYIAKGSYDPSWGTRIGDFYFNRFVGSFPDPIVAGYFFAAIAFSLFVVRRYVFSTLFFILLIFSLSKGAWLFFGQAVVLYVVGKKWNRLFWVGVLFFVALQLSLAAFLNASNKIHYLGFIGGVSSVFYGGIKTAILGYGLGDGGNLARGYVQGGALGAAWLGSGSESGIGVLIHQLGIVGFVIFLFNFYNVFRVGDSIFSSDKSLSLSGHWGVRSLTASVVINMPLQENCINASVLSSVLLGIVIISVLEIKNIQPGCPLNCSS